MAKIHDAVFNYVCIKNYKLEYEAKPDPKGDHLNKEYIVDVLMPYALWKKFKKAYKTVGSIEKAKTYTAAEYEASFKVAPPTDEKYQDEDGDFTVVKFRQRAYYALTDDKTKQPQVVGTKEIKSGGKVIGYKDSEGQDVGVEIEVGNGSTGTVQFRERTWTYGGKPGLSLDLVAIQVQKLVPYDGDDLEFDMEEEEVDSDTPWADDSDLADGDGKENPPSGGDQGKENPAEGW